MVGSAGRIEQVLGQRPAHFSFPYGDEGSAGPRDFALAREAGFKTAVTTRKGMLFPAHRRHLTALPRVSLNGEYQSLTYTALYLSGAPFALWNQRRLERGRQSGRCIHRISHAAGMTHKSPAARKKANCARGEAIVMRPATMLTTISA